ncbi:MAG: ATP-grasp domain-containing protein, partial [Pseudomonadota bacterium]
MSVRTVGIIGAGQLGRMLALSAVELDLDFVFLDPSKAPGAARFGRHIQAPFDNPEALKELAQSCDALTFEFENIPVSALQEIRAKLNPNPEALSIAQQRSVEKAYFESLGIPVARWAAVRSQAELNQAVQRLGTPLIAKTDRLGYDGKGQVRLYDESDAVGLYERMGSQDLCLESFVDFDYELSIVG